MRISRDFDPLILITTLLLCIIGLCLIYSVFHPHANGYTDDVDYLFFSRQLTWICFGIVAMFLGFAIPFRYYETLAHVFYAICLVLLVLVLFVKGGGPTQRWIPIGPMRLQPSEFTKIALLFAWGPCN